MIWAEELEKVKVGSGGVASFIDSDCRWGHLMKNKPFLGYKAHASADESGLVTSVQLLPGNASEGQHLPELIDEDEAKGIEAQSVARDAAYDSSANRRNIRDRGLKPEIPSHQRKKVANRFQYRPRKDTFRCPEGKESVGKCSHQRGGHIYYFFQAYCERYCLKESCLGPWETRKRFYLSEGARQEKQEAGKSKLKDAMKARKGIERRFG